MWVRAASHHLHLHHHLHLSHLAVDAAPAAPIRAIAANYAYAWKNKVVLVFSPIFCRLLFCIFYISYFY